MARRSCIRYTHLYAHCISTIVFVLHLSHRWCPTGHHPVMILTLFCHDPVITLSSPCHHPVITLSSSYHHPVITLSSSSHHSVIVVIGHDTSQVRMNARCIPAMAEEMKAVDQKFQVPTHPITTQLLMIPPLVAPFPHLHTFHLHLTSPLSPTSPSSLDTQVLLRKGIEATAVISLRAVRDLSEKIPPANNINPNPTNGSL